MNSLMLLIDCCCVGIKAVVVAVSLTDSPPS